MISNEELDKMIKKCKTSKELHELQIGFINETLGRITDKQALKICKAEDKLEEKERDYKRQ